MTILRQNAPSGLTPVAPSMMKPLGPVCLISTSPPVRSCRLEIAQLGDALVSTVQGGINAFGCVAAAQASRNVCQYDPRSTVLVPLVTSAHSAGGRKSKKLMRLVILDVPPASHYNVRFRGGAWHHASRQSVEDNPPAPDRCNSALWQNWTREIIASSQVSLDKAHTAHSSVPC